MSPAALKRALDPAYTGSPFAQPFQFFDGDVATPMDLTGRAVVMFLDRMGLPDRKVEVAGRIESDGRVWFEDAETSDWPSGDYFLEVRLDGVSVVVGRIYVARGAASGGSDAKGAAQPPTAPGVVIAGSGVVQVVSVAPSAATDPAGIILAPDLSAALGGAETLADALLWLKAQAENGGTPSPILRDLIGNVVISSVATGALSVAAAGQVLLSGAISSASSATGSLTVGAASSIALVGSAVSTSSLTGAMTVVTQVALAGAASVSSAVMGSLSVTAASNTLSLPPGALALYSLSFRPDAVTASPAQVLRQSDGAVMDIGWDALDRPDTAAVNTWAPGGWRWNIIYDLSGNGRHITVTGGNSNNNVNPTARSVRGYPTFSMFNRGSGLRVPDAVTGDMRSFTCLSVQDPFGIDQGCSTFQVGAAAPRAFLFAEGNRGVYRFYNTAGENTTIKLQHRATFTALVSNSTNQIVHADDATWSRGPAPAGTFVGGFIGYTDLAALYAAKSDLMLWGIWPGDLTTQISDIKTSCHARFGIDPARTANIVYVGDSIVFGLAADYGDNLSRQLIPLLNRQANIVNNGVSGQNLSAVYSQRATTVFESKRTGQSNVLVIEGGTNDLFVGTVKTANDLYNNYTLPLKQYALDQGYAGVVVMTILPRGGSGVNGTTEAQRLAYNQLVRDGAAANNYAVADVCADAAFDAAPTYTADVSNTAYYATDTIHIRKAGYAKMAAPYFADAINGFLIA